MLISRQSRDHELPSLGDRGKGKSHVRLLSGGLGLLILGIVLAFAYWPRTRLNVILITLDTTRADRIGVYGYPQARTPAIDALAKQGVLFESAYAPVPVTLPSHASMLTGLYPPEHGLHCNGHGKLGSSIPMLAEILRNANYQTGAFVASYVLNSKFGLNRGFQIYDDSVTPGTAGDEPEHQRKDGRFVVDAALEWLQAQKVKPFFCWIHLYDAHAYYDSRPDIFKDEFAERPYDAGIAYTDLQVQRIREFLRSEKLDQQTLIIVVGDHGEDLMDHQELQHGNQLYDSTMRVPLIFSGSPSVKAGQRVSAPVSLIDLTPTILDCLKVPQPNAMTGRSIKSALAGGQFQPRPCYLETDIPLLENRWAPLKGLVVHGWKYIETTHPELYDLKTDPEEKHDLAATQSDRQREMQAELQQLCAEMKPHDAAAVNLSAKEQKILESLGYMGARNSAIKPNVSEQLPDIKQMLPLFNQLMLARTQLRDGAIDEAVTNLRQILAKAPDYSQAQLVLGDALLAQQQFPEAITFYKAVAEARPDIGDAEGRWANALASQGLFVDAIPHYRKVLDVLPEASQYQMKLAVALVQLGRLREAITEFHDVIRRNPNHLNAHLELGNLLMQIGRMKEAIPHYEAVLQMEPTQILARLNLGSALAQAGRHAEAIIQVKKAINDAPENFEARYTLGMIFVSQQRFPEAIVELEEACRLRPDDVAAREELQHLQAPVNGKQK